MLHFNVKLEKKDGLDVIKLEAKEEGKKADVLFSPPKSPAELVIDLEFTLNELVRQVRQSPNQSPKLFK